MKENILEYICANSEKKRWTTQEIVSALGLSSYQARYYLMQLCHQKKLLRSPLGRGASTYWMLPEHEADIDTLPAGKQN